MEYKWQKENIESSSFNDETKKIVTKELDKTTDEQDPSYIKVLSHRKFKKDYKELMRMLKTYDRSIYNLLLNSPKIFPYIIKRRYNFPHQNFTPEILMEIETTFIEYLDDPELLKIYKKLIEEDKHLIHIEKNTSDNNICNMVNGRTISNGQDVYMSYYMKDSIEDLSILTHEFGHMFGKILFNNNESIFNILLTETESIYLELLMDYYIGQKLNEEKLQEMLISNRCLKCIEDIWTLKIKNISSHLPFYNEELINKINVGDSMLLTKEDRPLILNNDNFNLVKRILSTIVAFTLFEETKTDKKHGIELYKSMLNTSTMDFNTVLSEHNLTYTNLIINFYKNLKQSEELSNSLKR